MFKFLHAADVHLDSPLKGLARYAGAPADRIRQATRQALENLVQLALDEPVAFVLLAGDLYDGDWRDYNTGLYLVAQMARLRDAGIPVFIIAGNHDAANKMTKTLRLPDNVQVLPSSRPQTLRLDEWCVAVHGQGFATAAVTDDLSVAYPPAEPGCFNIGLLHTCAGGREGHEPYAPCTIDGLRTKGYDYWALGHVHQREVLHDDPLIVFPGNVQGRHIRESGSKGCTLVTVDDGRAIRAEHHALDVLRWEECRVEAPDLESGYDVVDRFGDQVGDLLRRSANRLLAVRVQVSGPCPAHARLLAEPQRWTNEIRAKAAEVGGGDVWVEKVELRTCPPRAGEPEPADGPIGELLQYIAEVQADEGRLGELGDELADLQRKLPAELKEGPSRIGLDDPGRLREALEQVREMLVSRLLSEGTPR